MLLDFLGDVVCGGFGTPIARSMADKLVIVCSNEGQSMYAANNIASAVKYFADQGGKTRVLGLFVNKDDGSGKAAKLAEWLGVPVLASLPLLPQAEVMEFGNEHPKIKAAVDKVIDAIINDEALYPKNVDFHQFMCALSGSAAEMDGTAVTSDELWSLPEVIPDRARPSFVLDGIPNGGAFDHRYVESEDDAEKALVPTVISAGGFAVPKADW
jgi:chlorophyllide a reductase subunit X